jgi:ferredoxin--NADP+ reductase
VQDVWNSGRIGAAWGIDPAPEHTHVLLCGNPMMIEEMVAMLAGKGFSEHTRQHPGQVHVERYW